MQIGLLADLHANRPALEAVASDMPPVDRLLCAGDVVGYNPWPGDCVDWLRDRGVPTVMANHDRMVISGRNFRGNRMARAGVSHARETLDNSQRDWLADRPETLTALEGRVKVVHGHPDDPDRYTYPEEFGAHLLDDEEVLVLGHTHVQAYLETSDGIVVNPGSVGQPRDGDPRAAYAVVDLDGMTVTEHRVAYDIDAVVEAVKREGLPLRTARRLREGR